MNIFTLTSTRSMAPDFSHKRKSRLIYETVVPMKIHLLHHVVSFHPLSIFLFLSVFL